MKDVSELRRRSVIAIDFVQDGAPVLLGTRMKVSQLLGEIADKGSIEAVAYDFDLNTDALRSMLIDLAILTASPHRRISDG